MAVRTNGAELKRYYADASAWPDGWWHENEEITVDGLPGDGVNPLEIKDESLVVIKGGVIYEGSRDAEGMRLEGHFRKWRKAQATGFLAAGVSKNRAEHVFSNIVKAGGKIVR